MKLEEKIAAQRKAHGLSQEALAEQLGVSRQAISRWEQGIAQPDAGNLVQLSRAFGGTTDYLLHEDYETDQDLPPVRTARRMQLRQVITLLATMEVVVLLLQFLSAFVLQSDLALILCLIPLAVVIGGFEVIWQREGKADPSCRCRFYQITAWLGLYFPLRMVMDFLSGFYPRPYNVLAFEALILAVYLAAALGITLGLEKFYRSRKD